MPPTCIQRDPPLVIVVSKTRTLEPTYELSVMFPGIRVEPLFGDAERHALYQLIRRAWQLTRSYRPARFGRMYRVRLPPISAWAETAPTTDLAVQLRHIMFASLPVKSVSVQTVIAPLPITDGPPPVTAQDQKHLDAAPTGLDVASVWALTGGRGQDEVLCDVERGWHMDHSEFSGIHFERLPLGLRDDIYVPHGTQVLSIAVARENGEFGVGVAPGVTTVVLASEVTGASSGPETHQAILEAMVELTKSKYSPGSVLLLETQEEVTTGVWGPSETVRVVFDMIQLAVANHIIVVEAAGNGGTSDLDLNAAPSLLYGDSGAILVGQSTWSSGAGHVSMTKGCTGDRINCFGWGSGVYAASASPFGVDPVTKAVLFEDIDDAAFGGTSAASAMIAGAALVVQGLVRKGAATPLGYLPPMQMRAVLGDRLGVNTPLESLATDVIGVMPNLKNIAVNLGLLPDLYIRDNVGDTGGTHTGMLCKSPDIILRTTALTAGTPDDEFGEGSGTEDKVDLSEDLTDGEADARIYVRVRNRGGKDVVGAKVTVYYADSATLVEPGAWKLIGSTLLDVPAGDTLTVTDAIPFPAVPVAGHYCFIATVDHVDDAIFTPDSFTATTGFSTGFDLFKDYVRRSNNVAWRNFNVIEVPSSGLAALPTSVMGPWGDVEDLDMELRVEAHLPSGATLEIEVPARMRSRMDLPEHAFSSGDRAKLSTSSVTLLGFVRMRARERHEVMLHVRLPRLKKCMTGVRAIHEVALVQLHNGQPVGRVTWRLVRQRARPAREAGASPA